MRVWLLLGVAFVASVCVSCSNTREEQLCLEICESEKDPYLLQLCKNRCKLVPEREKEEEEEERGSRERGRQEGEKEEKKRDERELPQPPHHHQHKDDRQRGKESEEEEKKDEQLWRGRHRWDDPEERERVRQRVEEEDIRRRRHKKDLPVDGYDPQTYHNNPFYFTSRMFTTRYKNQYGHIRILHPFHLRFPKLLNYMIVEFMFKPNTLLLPAHADIDSIIVILSGKALVTFFNPNNRQNYYLQPGYAQRIPPGTTFTVANLENNQDLRLIKLAIPVNEPAHYQNFFLSSTQDQQSYLQGFSPNILQASFNAEFEEIYRVLFGGEGHEGEQRQQEGVIVELSEEQIQELSKHAKSTSRKPIPFQYEPFYLRSPYPIYSNNFGKFFEVTPENNPQLKDLDIYLNSVDINEGALLLPHFNSKAIVILVIIEGKANVELVGIQPEQQEEQETREVQRYEAELSQDDIFVIPAAYPVVVNATTNLSFFAFGINAENNRRIFLAGERDNVITHMYRAVKELAFPGSARDLQKLLKNQKGSYFVDARARPLSSILGALYYT